MSSRCTGHCCREFTLHLEDVFRLIFNPEEATDGVMIGDMIRFVRRIEPGEKLLSGDMLEGDYPAHIWTCRHFDRAMNNCTVYETRPAMCRDFPYGKPCPMPACEWDEGKAGEHPRRLPMLAEGVEAWPASVKLEGTDEELKSIERVTIMEAT